jgi:hypothetical protein
MGIIKGKLDRNLANCIASLMEDMETSLYMLHIESDPEGSKKCADAAASMFVFRLRGTADHVEVKHKYGIGAIVVNIYYRDSEVELEMELRTKDRHG